MQYSRALGAVEARPPVRRIEIDIVSTSRASCFINASALLMSPRTLKSRRSSRHSPRLKPKVAPKTLNTKGLSSFTIPRGSAYAELKVTAFCVDFQ